MIRIGQGLDFHRFKEGRKLILGGVEIDYHLGLDGHSDADVLLHTLSDAILGALALGDIGEHYPDTDPRWKGLDSKVILKDVLDKASSRGYGLVNIDITMIGEEPKLSPHKEKIKESLSQLTGLALDRINLKATTTEKMGDLGRKEGLGCLGVVLLERRDYDGKL